jgi:hypothetical protein
MISSPQISIIALVFFPNFDFFILKDRFLVNQQNQIELIFMKTDWLAADFSIPDVAKWY